MAATESVSWRERASQGRAAVLTGITPEAGVLAVALPLLFIHARYQPTIHIAAGSTTVGIQLADFAVLAIVLAAASAGVRRGFAPLARGRWLWLALLAYYLWIGIEILVPRGTSGYATAKHAVTAAKFLEYAFLAPAVVVIVRRRAEVGLAAAVLTAWSVVATTVGVVQFFGAKIVMFGATGGRQASFIGFHDFAALSSAALLAGAVAILLPRLGLDERIARIGLVSGSIGVIISAALAAVVGIVAAMAFLLVLVLLRRELRAVRAAAVVCVVAIAVGGALWMRSTDLGRYLGLKHEHGALTVESYRQRSLLAWIGWQMFKDHPVAGVGWQASGEPSRFERYLPAARRRFTNQPPIAFPSRQHRWGVQNFYVQTLADLGVVGLLSLLAVYACGLRLARGRVRRSDATAAVVATVWILAVAGLWIAQGIVAGLPLDALTWMSFGLAAGG